MGSMEMKPYDHTKDIVETDAPFFLQPPKTMLSWLCPMCGYFINTDASRRSGFEALVRRHECDMLNWRTWR